MYYDLWDMRSSNLVESFDTEASALEMVREVADDYGDSAIDAWALIAGYESSKEKKVIAHGRNLLDRARAIAAA